MLINSALAKNDSILKLLQGEDSAGQIFGHQVKRGPHCNDTRIRDDIERPTNQDSPELARSLIETDELQKPYRPISPGWFDHTTETSYDVQSLLLWKFVRQWFQTLGQETADTVH